QAEHDAMLAQRERMRRADALSSAAGVAAEALLGDSAEAGGSGGGGGGGMVAAAAGLDALHGVDPRLDELAERVRALSIESDDLATELRAYAEQPDTGESA